MEKKFETKYGYFSDDGKEYVITRHDTPKPWVNIICPGDYGFAFSHTGSGYSWRTHASTNRITRWEQDLIKDEWGKYIYCRDSETGEYWSLGWQPVKAKPDFYECRHGVGYSTITSENNGVRSSLTVFVPPNEPLEIWRIKLSNRTTKSKKLDLFTYMEWCLGMAPDSHREFHRLFIETEYSDNHHALLATKRLWTIGNAKGQAWNRNWEYYAFHSVNVKPTAWETDKEKFIGQYGSLEKPACMANEKLSNHTGKWQDGIGSLQSSVVIEPGKEQEIVFVLGCAETKNEALKYAKKYQDISAADDAWLKMGKFWNNLLSPLEINTPDEAFNILTNTWLKYQAISARAWGRTGYFQTGGAYGYRDQLQDSHIFLPLAPEFTRRQILLHAAHQFVDGTTYHWWHPITEDGMRKKYNDDLLWLPFVTMNYIKETADFKILNEKVNYLEDNGKVSKQSGTVYDHCRKAIDTFWTRLSKRGVPLMGAGDWNDGLSTIGWLLKSESVWLGHFLVGILEDWVELEKHLPKKNPAVMKKYSSAAKKMRADINKHFWDGNWYIRATKDNGTAIGSSSNKDGKIFLNAQTWSIINKTAPIERLPKVLKSMQKYLYRDYGPILFWPAYHKVDEEIGYLTRYAPGSRENGGLYTHAGVWAVWAECILGRNEQAWKLYKSFCPIYRGQEPDFYQVEPYVSPGNVDGPDSPYFGRAGWTWYTGSAAWLFRISTEWILGVRPSYEGLIIDPCIPKDWKGFTFKRRFRGAAYDIKVETAGKCREILLDGKPWPSNIIPAFGDGKLHTVIVK